MAERISVTLVPHTHWDREWYEPFDRFRERLVTMMDTLLDLADRGFPHFHLDGQTAMVDDYLDVRPENEERIRRHATEGRLSLGPWFTQMDEFLTSGESHIRNLERGMRRARELGRALEVGYMPDQFGHIGQMPQLLQMEGIDRAVVWRGVPRAIDTTSFWWEAPDGSRVLTEYMAFSYSNGERLPSLHEPADLATELEAVVERSRSFLPTPRLLVMVGADHTGPDEALPERLAAAAPLARSLDARVGGLDRHLDGLMADDAPTWRGELRSSARAHLLPNVYSARAHQKRERGRVEALIERYAEPLAALVPGFRWPAAELDRAWQLQLWNGAHDSACGCSHDQVARDVDARFAEARSIGEAIVARAIATLGALLGARGTLRFNPSPFERHDVPPLGWRVTDEPPAAGDEPVRLELDEGWLRAGDVRFTLRDEPDVGDLYNWCYAERGQLASPPTDVRLDGSSALVAFDGFDATLRASRRRDESFVRLDGEIDNRHPNHRLRLHVALPAEPSGSVAGAPFELVARPLASEGSSLEPPSPTWPARHVVLAAGIAAYHEGVFEYELDGRELAITLLRCVGTISRETMPTRPWAAGPGVLTPDAQMIGRTAFSLGLRAHAGRDDVLADWERFALPLLDAPANGGGDLPARGSLVDIAGNVQLSSVRRIDDRLEVRVWNPNDETIHARIDHTDVDLGPSKIVQLSADAVHVARFPGPEACGGEIPRLG
jgi:hypothetical protein